MENKTEMEKLGYNGDSFQSNLGRLLVANYGDEDRDKSKNNRKAEKLIVDASRILKEFAEQTECSHFVPWGDIVSERLPEFESIVLNNPDYEVSSLLSFSNLCRSLAEELE